MPVPVPIAYPPFDVLGLRHVSLRVPDLDRARDFYVGTLGLIVSDATADGIWLRGASEPGHHCLVLQKGAQAAVTALGCKLQTEEDIELAAHWCENAGLPATWVDRAHQGRTLASLSPEGVPVEFYAAMDAAPDASHDPTPVEGLDHATLATADVGTAAGYWNALGFRASQIETQQGDALDGIRMQRRGGGAGVDLTRSDTALTRPSQIALRVSGATDLSVLAQSGNGALDNSGATPVLRMRDPHGLAITLCHADGRVVDPDQPPLKARLRSQEDMDQSGPPFASS